MELLDAYWAVYAHFMRGIPPDKEEDAHRLLDAPRKAEVARDDGLTKGDVDYLAALGLTPEDVRRTQREKAKKGVGIGGR